MQYRGTTDVFAIYMSQLALAYSKAQVDSNFMEIGLQFFYVGIRNEPNGFKFNQAFDATLFEYPRS